MMEDFILRIGKDTNHIKAAKSIETQILQGKKVFVDVIGVAANYIAVKAFIQLNSALSDMKITVSYSPSYVDIKTFDGEVKTAVRWKFII